jgi:hypothetical protein
MSNCLCKLLTLQLWLLVFLFIATSAFQTDALEKLFNGTLTGEHDQKVIVTTSAITLLVKASVKAESISNAFSCLSKSVSQGHALIQPSTDVILPVNNHSFLLS